MKTSLIKSILLEWIKQNLEKMIIVLIVLIASIYGLYKFQEVINGQKSVVTEIEKQGEIHKLELKKVTEAYIAENKALKENLRVYKERIVQIEKEYESDLNKHEENKDTIVSNIVKESNGDPKKMADAVSAATGFISE